MAPYAEIHTFVQHLAPTWRKTQQAGGAQLIAALLERPELCLSNLARALPAPTQSLHGRLKRLMRWLDNPRLDELALTQRWLPLSYRFGTDPPEQSTDQPLLPILLDTTYFHPAAALIAAVPCGSRGLPIALTTYHRKTLHACFPPETTWPDRTQPLPSARQRQRQPTHAASTVQAWRSQNLIEEHLLDLVWHFVSPALRGVVVADRGFARASLFRHLRDAKRDFVIRFDADTWIQLPPDGPGQPAKVALALQPDQRRWVPGGTYHQHDQVPVNLLAVWDAGQEEPWYLATTLERADWAELLYRWRMRIECGNRDEKTGVLLREGGDAHALRSLRHLHRLLLALCLAHWLCALTGLQAWHDLPPAPMVPPDPAVADARPAAAPAPEPALALETLAPNRFPDPAVLAAGPAYPPAVVPHRGPPRPLPGWQRPFAVRGELSYVRLGMEILRTAAFHAILRRLVHWLGIYLWSSTPAWRRGQVRYRLKRWWGAE